jgi:hypothetical protein
VPPRLEQRAPGVITAVSGERVLLPCEVTGKPIPDIEWRKNHMNIDFFDMGHKYLMEETGSLVIPEVDVEDSARFLCIAENPAGVISQEIQLIVYGQSVSLLSILRRFGMYGYNSDDHIGRPLMLMVRPLPPSGQPHVILVAFITPSFALHEVRWDMIQVPKIQSWIHQPFVCFINYS